MQESYVSSSCCGYVSDPFKPDLAKSHIKTNSSALRPRRQKSVNMDDDNEYLQPNFDPTTLRVADLRRILLFHDVEFPSSAKKSQLVNLFLDNITPKAKGILQKKSRVRPSNKGIIKIEKDEYGEVQPQIYLPEEEAERSSPRKRRSTAATPAKAPAKTPRKSSTKTPLRVLPTPSDDEPEERATAFKVKKVWNILNTNWRLVNLRHIFPMTTYFNLDQQRILLTFLVQVVNRYTILNITNADRPQIIDEECAPPSAQHSRFGNASSNSIPY
jgi:HeH/LEM domain